MLKMMLRTILVLATLTVLTVGGLYVYNKDRTYYNKEDEVGNTPGNLYNGGLFAEQDGLIYFSNDYDDGTLYVMTSDCTGIRKLSNDKAVFINADENYVYYIKAKDSKFDTSNPLMPYRNTGVYRINQNGTGLKNYSGSPSSYLTLKGNNLYFNEYNTETGIVMYRYKIDQSDKRLLLEADTIPALVKDNELLYIDQTDQSIGSLFLKSYTTNPRYKGSYKYPIVLEDYIYYINPSDKNKLYRMNLDGSDPTVIVKNNCSTYNITNSGKYLYYQVKDKKKKGIYRIDLDTMKAEKIKSGQFKQIHVTDKYVFFKANNDSNTYFMTADGDGKVSNFSSLLTTE